MKKITFILFAFVCSFGFSQTFTDTGGPYDMQNGNGTTAATCGTADEIILPLAVTGIGTLGGTNSIQSVTINVTHTWSDDVVISLQDPSGAVTVLLMDDKGGQADGFAVTLIDGATPLPDAGVDGPAITGTYAPDEALGAFNSGTVADGTWNLLVCDDAGADIGTVDDWSITFGLTPSCSTPTGAAVANITTTSADFSWNNVATATLGFEWGILAPGGDPDVDPFLFSGATGAGVILASEAGLSPSTVYVFYVRSNCDSAGISPWSAGTAFTSATPPPANDNACDAIMLNVGDASSGAFYTNANATLETGEVPGTCYFGTPSASNTIWFSFVAPSSGEVLIQTEELAGDGTLNDTQITVFTLADCADLTTGVVEVACDEDDDDDVVGDGSGLQANLQLVGLVAGDTYYFVVDGFGTDVGTFDVSLTGSTLGVDSLENELAFNYFPNPVRNELTLNAQKEIQNVSVYNMLGQEVIRTSPNAVVSTINMNDLSQGAYFVKVTIDDVTETVRILKQ